MDNPKSLVGIAGLMYLIITTTSTISLTIFPSWTSSFHSANVFSRRLISITLLFHLGILSGLISKSVLLFWLFCYVNFKKCGSPLGVAHGRLCGRTNSHGVLQSVAWRRADCSAGNANVFVDFGPVRLNCSVQ